MSDNKPLPESAEENLRVIRQLMERATIYRAVSAPAALSASLLTFVASTLWAWHLSAFGPLTPTSFAALWASVLILTLIINFSLLFRQAPPRSSGFFTPAMRMALISAVPALLTGLILSFYVLSSVPTKYGPQITVLLWLITYGLAILSTQSFAPRSLVLLGWAFLLTGVAVIPLSMNIFRETITQDWLALSGNANNQVLGIITMAITFGGYHLIYAIATWKAAVINDASDNSSA